MRRLLIVAALILATSAWAGTTVKRGPGQSVGGASILRGQTGLASSIPSTSDMMSDWYCAKYQFYELGDIWATGAGTNWIATITGAATLTNAVGTGAVFPPFMKIATSALDDDSIELQHTGTGGNRDFAHGTGVTNDRTLFFDIFVRIAELDTVAEDASTAAEVDLFMGWATNPDTTVIDGTGDFVGLLMRDITLDATGPIRLVADSNGGAAAALITGFNQPIGWTRGTPGIGDAEVNNNRAARIFGPANWTRFTFYSDVTVPAIEGDGIVHVWVNGDPAVGSPYTVVGALPNGKMVPTIAFQNGEAAGRRLDIAWATWCREMRAGGGTGTYPNDTVSD